MQENDPTRDATWYQVREFWSVFLKTTPHIIFQLLHTESTRRNAKRTNPHPMNAQQKRFVEAMDQPELEARIALVPTRQRELIHSFGGLAILGLKMTRSAARNSLSHRTKKI